MKLTRFVTASAGSRHEATLALAGALLHSGWGDDDSLKFIEAVVTAGDDDEVPDRLRAVLDTTDKKSRGERFTGWPTLSELFDDKVITRIRQWLNISDAPILSVGTDPDSRPSGDWPELIPLRREIRPAEPFPIEALGDVLGPMAKAMMEIVQAPDAVCGQSVLAAAELAVQAHANIEIDGRVSPLSNFHITVAETGERKTATDREALAPHSKRQGDMRGPWEVEMLEYEAELSAWRSCYDKELGSKGPASIEEKKTAALALGPPPQRPPAPILTTEEPTYEGLVKALDRDWPAMGLFSDEGGRFLGGHGMNKENMRKTAAGLSKLWDGSPITRTRSGDGNMVIYGKRVSLHLMVQPHVSELLLGNEQLKDQGLLSRCLVAWPDSTIGQRPYKARSLRDDVRATRYFARLMEVLGAPLSLAEGKNNELNPRCLVLEPSAKALWVGFHDHIERQCRADQPLASIKGLAAKGAEHTLRLAGTLALVENLAANRVEQRHVEAGIELTNYYLAEAERLFEATFDASELRQAEKVGQWLHEYLSRNSRNSRFVYLSEILQNGPRFIRTKDKALEILKILVEHGTIRPIHQEIEIDGSHRQNIWELRGSDD